MKVGRRNELERTSDESLRREICLRNATRNSVSVFSLFQSRVSSSLHDSVPQKSTGRIKKNELVHRSPPSSDLLSHQRPPPLSPSLSLSFLSALPPAGPLHTMPSTTVSNDDVRPLSSFSPLLSSRSFFKAHLSFLPSLSVPGPSAIPPRQKQDARIRLDHPEEALVFIFGYLIFRREDREEEERGEGTRADRVRWIFGSTQ